jgi:hypothetical protein
LTDGLGVAWFEEIGLALPVVFEINGVNLLPETPDKEEVMAVGPGGEVSGPAGLASHVAFRLPLLNVVRAGRRAVTQARTDGRSRWRLPGGGEVTFELSADGTMVTVSGGPTRQVRLPVDVAASDLAEAFDRFAVAADEYVATYLPELIAARVWSRRGT